MRIKRLVPALLLPLALSMGLLASCSSNEAAVDSTTGAADSTTTAAPATEAPATDAPTTTAAPSVLRIMVTNDDGVGADGIDAIVNALLEIENVEVTVVAPATNQSGTGGKTTDGTLTVTDATTKSGYPAKAVAGFPADTVVWAIDQGGIDFIPDLVVSGVNEGQNYSLEIVPVSGTVGAARAAAMRNIPSVAISQGKAGEGVDYPAAVAAGVEWVRANFDALVNRADDEAVADFVNINAPTCAEGTEIKGVIEVPIGSLNNTDYNAQDCTPDAAGTPDPTTDVEGFQHGYVVVSRLPVNGAPFA